MFIAERFGIKRSPDVGVLDEGVLDIFETEFLEGVFILSFRCKFSREKYCLKERRGGQFIPRQKTTGLNLNC